MPLTPQGETPAWLNALMLLFLTVTTLYMLLQMKEREEEAEEERRLVTIEACGSKTVEREYKPGDYVGKMVGTCEDGSPRRIEAIYAVKAPKGRKGLLGLGARQPRPKAP
ncbi:hypothetical protein [Stetteria hydrogenophila]